MPASFFCLFSPEGAWAIRAHGSSPWAGVPFWGTRQPRPADPFPPVFAFPRGSYSPNVRDSDTEPARANEEESAARGFRVGAPLGWSNLHVLLRSWVSPPSGPVGRSEETLHPKGRLFFACPQAVVQQHCKGFRYIPVRNETPLGRPPPHFQARLEAELPGGAAQRIKWS